MEQGIVDFFPSPDLYFKCYYEKTPMKDTAKFQTEKVAACDKLHSTNQKELLKCYDYIKHPYNLDAQIKVCTDEFKALSELDELYKCMEQYNVKKNEEYCNLSPKYSQFVDEYNF